MPTLGCALGSPQKRAGDKFRLRLIAYEHGIREQHSTMQLHSEICVFIEM